MTYTCANILKTKRERERGQRDKRRHTVGKKTEGDEEKMSLESKWMRQR